MNKKTHHLPHSINLDKKWWLVLTSRSRCCCHDLCCWALACRSCHSFGLAPSFVFGVTPATAPAPIVAVMVSADGLSLAGPVVRSGWPPHLFLVPHPPLHLLPLLLSWPLLIGSHSPVLLFIWAAPLVCSQYHIRRCSCSHCCCHGRTAGVACMCTPTFVCSFVPVVATIVLLVVATLMSHPMVSVSSTWLVYTL